MSRVSQLLTVPQVAHLLQVSPKTIRNWVYLQKIPHHKINGVVRFVWQEIEGWMTQR